MSDTVTPWTVAPQAPLSTGFSRQEYWPRLPFPPPGDLPDPGIEPGSAALKAVSLLTELRGTPSYRGVIHYFFSTLTVLRMTITRSIRVAALTFDGWCVWLFLLWGCYQYHCYEHLCPGFSLDTCFLFSVVCVESDRMGRLSHRLTLSLTFWKTVSKYFPKWLHQLIGS